MVQSQFSLSWSSYKNNICSGFTSLQQNGELVDMTLAADGHLVKVHQVLLALASPYLKELLASAPCQHPVLFLNNISHKTLTLLLEYIYTGEVLVPADGLSTFTEAAKALHIKGLENITNGGNMNLKMALHTSQIEDNSLCHVSGTKRIAVPTDEGSEEVDMPAAARKIFVRRESPRKKSTTTRRQNESTIKHSFDAVDDDKMDYTDNMMDDSHIGDDDDDDDYKPNEDYKITNKKDSLETAAPNLQYTVSIRGSLQVILNRYIYNLHSMTHRTNVRRWRCVEYRNKKCMAFVVTKDNVVLNRMGCKTLPESEVTRKEALLRWQWGWRANLHNHAFHDSKILAKIEKQAVYSALDQVTGYNEKGVKKSNDNDSMMENESLPVLEDFTPEVSNK